ncbi:hypothetical protein ACWFRF_29150 [Nocardia sp. NPDC055165]
MLRAGNSTTFVHYELTGGERRLHEALDAQTPAADSARPAEVDSAEPGTGEPDLQRA